MKIITFFYNLLWGDLIIVPLPGGSTLGLSLLVPVSYTHLLSVHPSLYLPSVPPPAHAFR